MTLAFQRKKMIFLLYEQMFRKSYKSYDSKRIGRILMWSIWYCKFGCLWYCKFGMGFVFSSSFNQNEKCIKSSFHSLKNVEKTSHWITSLRIFLSFFSTCSNRHIWEAAQRSSAAGLSPPAPPNLVSNSADKTLPHAYGFPTLFHTIFSAVLLEFPLKLSLSVCTVIIHCAYSLRNFGR